MTKIDKSTFKEYFDLYYMHLCKYAWIYCKDQEQSKEIVQEVFIKIWEKRDELDIKGPIVSYLYRTVENRSLNFIRDNKKSFAYVELPADLNIEDEKKSDFQMEPEAIREAISSLPDRCRQIFELKKIHGLSYKEISAKLMVSEKTVENQMGIALKKLREYLGAIKNSLGDS